MRSLDGCIVRRVQTREKGILAIDTWGAQRQNNNKDGKVVQVRRIVEVVDKESKESAVVGDGERGDGCKGEENSGW